MSSVRTLARRVGSTIQDAWCTSASKWLLAAAFLTCSGDRKTYSASPSHIAAQAFRVSPAHWRS